MATRTLIVGSIALALMALGAGFLFYTNSQASRSCGTLSPRPTVAAFGDSLVAGYGAPEGQDFVSGLSRRVGVPIKNYGRSGDTSAQGLARAREMLERPDIVIVVLGGNDALQKIPIETTKQNLSQVIELFQSYQSKQVRVVLVGVMGGFPNDPFAAMYKDLAKQYGVTYVPNILSGLFGNQRLMSDQVHPNGAGYEKIAERLEPILNKECAGVQKEI